MYVVISVRLFFHPKTESDCVCAWPKVILNPGVYIFLVCLYSSLQAYFCKVILIVPAILSSGVSTVLQKSAFCSSTQGCFLCSDVHESTDDSALGCGHKVMKITTAETEA